MTPTNPQKYACTSFSEFSVELRIIALSLRDFIMLFLRKQLFREDEWLNCVNCQYVGYLYECIYIICFYFHCIQGHHQVSGEIQTVVNIYLQCFVYILSLHIVKTVFKKLYPCFIFSSLQSFSVYSDAVPPCTGPVTLCSTLKKDQSDHEPIELTFIAVTLMLTT